MKKITLLNEKTDASVSEVRLKYDDTFMVDFRDYLKVRIYLVCETHNGIILEKAIYTKKSVNIDDILSLFNNKYLGIGNYDTFDEKSSYYECIEKIKKEKTYTIYFTSLENINKIPLLLST